jgi:hypothetical protein
MFVISTYSKRHKAQAVPVGLLVASLRGKREQRARRIAERSRKAVADYFRDYLA